jgi:uncharacterized membrane protein
MANINPGHSPVDDGSGGGDLPAFTFRAIALLFGLLFVFLIPPLQSPDEPAHFLRAYQISEGGFFPEKRDNRMGGMLPSAVVMMCDSFMRLRCGLEVSPVQVPHKSRVFADFANTAMYAPVAYLPQASGIAIARMMGATPSGMLYAARLGNLFVWLLFISAAIRVAGAWSNMVVFGALLPAGLVISASASADVLTNGICWWLAARLLSGRIDWQGMAGLAVAAVGKLIVFPLALLSRPGGASYRKMLLLLLAGLFAALGWGFLAKGWFIPYDHYHQAYRDMQTLNPGVDPGRQAAYIMNNPVAFAGTVTTSLVRALPSAAAHFVGKFGWEKNYIPSGWIAVLWLVLAAALCTVKNPLPLRWRRLAAVIVLIYVTGFAITNYMLWNAVGADSMDNWQGRYFVPVAPAAGLIFGNTFFVRWERAVLRVGLLLLVLGNISMICSILERYQGLIFSVPLHM